MQQPLTYLKESLNDDWLIGYDSREFYNLTQQLYLELIQLIPQQLTPPKIFLAQHDPIKFLAGFLAACAANCPVFLCNPNWTSSEWQQVLDLVQPDLIWGENINSSFPLLPSLPFPLPSPSMIMIPTGGSSGKIRFTMHTWETLTASVQGFQDYFKTSKINSFCVLPLYHVSGLMQFIRSFITGGKFIVSPFKALENNQIPQVDVSEFFLSLVPTQLQRLLQKSNSYLSDFQTVLLGGAPAWLELLEQARNHKIKLAPTYGMTETASQIVTLKPQDFLKGNNSCGRVLPHAKVSIHNSTNEILSCNQIGVVTIEATSLTLGYYPNLRNKKYLQLDDLGFFDEQGYLNIVGRTSNKIITGGENVFPSEVEAAILATNLVKDVCVIGLPNNYWGEVVTAIYIPVHSGISQETIRLRIQNKLSKFKQPKYWFAVESLPRNTQGKVNREKLQHLAKSLLQASEKQAYSKSQMLDIKAL